MATHESFWVSVHRAHRVIVLIVPFGVDVFRQQTNSSSTTGPRATEPESSSAPRRRPEARAHWKGRRSYPQQIRDRLRVFALGETCRASLFGISSPGRGRRGRHRSCLCFSGRPERGGRVSASSVNRRRRWPCKFLRRGSPARRCRRRSSLISVGAAGAFLRSGIRRCRGCSRRSRDARHRNHQGGDNAEPASRKPAPLSTRVPQARDTLAVLGNLVETRELSSHWTRHWRGSRSSTGRGSRWTSGHTGRGSRWISVLNGTRIVRISVLTGRG